MHFGFALELSNIDLWNIDLLDTHLDLLDTDIPSKYFVSLHSAFKTSWRYVFKTSWRQVFKTSSRRLQRNIFSSFKTSSRLLGRSKIVTLKIGWRRLQDMSWKWARSSNFYKWFAAKSEKIQVFTYLLKNVPLIVNDGKPKRKIENEVSP